MTADGVHSWLIGLMRKDPADFGRFVSCHRMIFQEALCAKQLKVESVMTAVMKIVNFIRAKALNHRQFWTQDMKMLFFIKRSDAVPF